jgi:hypothetical protein
MKREHAFEAIKAILSAIDDDELPKPSKIEQDEGRTVVWFGGMGRYLGSAKRNGELEPLIYRERGVNEAIDHEAIYRIDRQHQSGAAE